MCAHPRHERAEAVARLDGAQGSIVVLLPEPDPGVLRPVDGAIPIVQ